MKNLNTNKTNFLITIAGPTAVGKTDTVLKLAEYFDSHVFSCDSRQLYREMHIGTAKPTSIELAKVKHHFIDHVSIQETYSAGRFEREFNEAIVSYFKEKNIAILTGGTGMYIKAAIEGLDEFPEVNEEIKQKYAALLSEGGLELFQNMLIEKDPEYAKIVDLENTRRIGRALEVMEAGEKTFSSYLNQKLEKKPPFVPIQICLTRPREELYKRINERVDQMMNQGQLDEAKRLHKFRGLRSLETVGYTELFNYIEGKYDLNHAIELIKRNSRRYAKRQMTWFRNQGIWKMCSADDFDGLLSYLVDEVGKRLRNT